MDIRVTDDFVFECPYCGAACRAGDGIDSEGEHVQFLVHVLPYCAGFERDTPPEFIAAFVKKSEEKLN